ncbi:MAG: 2-oxoacid:acceptor oxidoreductase subunit alpha [Methanotrichaceae archaeon]|nr:2-oxoacid:acceptor oxidoreductase subunit alpha [Methanotrichaceae archaeon]
MDEFSTLIGGIAGDGINEAGLTLGRLFSRLGYCIYMYYDYPSLIRGGHNFSIVRAAKGRVSTHTDAIDVLIALNQETIEKHEKRLKDSSFVIYDSDQVKAAGLEQKGCGLPVSDILKQEDAPKIMRNTCILGGFCRVVGIDWQTLESVLKKHIPKKLEQNLKVARRGYDSAVEFCRVDRALNPVLPLLTGNQAVGLGFLKAGLKAYVAYPMTPSSSTLHFLADQAPGFGLKVVHPENEIAVMLMAQGFAYAGQKTAIGTSGGGFCLMCEGLSMSGMAEMPVAILMSQRAGPSTGIPTYTAQGDLHFILNAGQGEFPRFVVSPGDAEESYYWSGVALNLAWKYQVPSFVLIDKSVSEGLYSFDLKAAGDLSEEDFARWDGQGKYDRYRQTDSGVSPLAFPPQKGQAIKVDSYTHDQHGVTSEDPQVATEMSDKRLLKGQSLARELENYETVKVKGRGKTALLCWGSNKGVCEEIGLKMGLKVIQVLVLSPFPADRLSEALEGVEKVIAVECNSTGQLAKLCGFYGFPADELILKYDGRPFSVEDLESRLTEVEQ